MTINDAIAALNLAAVAVYLALGAALLWQARSRWREWPVSAFVALAGPYIVSGLVFAQLAGWRLGDWPGEVLDPTGVLTLALRAWWVGVGVALLQRIVWGRLLNPRDRSRVDRAP